MAWAKVDRQARNRLDRSGSIAMTLTETTINDSDKTLDYDADIGEGRKFLINSVRVDYTATITAGTRILVVQVRDSAANVIAEMQLATTMVASDAKVYQVARGLAQAAGTLVNSETLPDELSLLPGQSLRVLDSAAVDAAADDMLLYLSGELE